MGMSVPPKKLRAPFELVSVPVPALLKKVEYRLTVFYYKQWVRFYSATLAGKNDGVSGLEKRYKFAFCHRTVNVCVPFYLHLTIVIAGRGCGGTECDAIKNSLIFFCCILSASKTKHN